MNILDAKRKLLPLSGYMGDSGGGGGGSQPDKTTQVTELPAWARPYAKDTLAKGAALTDINQNPYQTYGANRIAGFSPLQEQSFQGAANMQPSQQLGTGSDLASAAGIGALGTNYQAGQFTNQFQDPGQYQPGQFSMSQVQGPDLQNFQMGPAERVRTQSFTRPGSAEQYMSPYMQNVVDIQKREAQRQSGIQGTQQQAQAVGAGAFGGSRDAIMRAERERNLGQQMGDIQATGSQAAFQQAQQQFNAEQQARLQAQQANQQAGLTVGGQNLAALLGVQQLGAGQNLQSQLANQQAFQQAQNAAEQSRQFGAGQGLQAAGLGAQYGQAAQQMGEQSRQYGAGLGMQGLQTALQGAGQLGQLGGQQFQQGMDINKLQSAYGGQMQQQAQRPLDQAYQDFLNQQNYPYKQLGFMSDLVRGLPLGQQSTSSIYQAPGSMLGQLGGLGMGAYGVSQMMRAEGGTVHDYAEGGVTSSQNVEGILSKLSDQQLQQAKQMALSRRDVEQANMIDAELSQRASIRGGLGGAFNQLPEEQQEEMMAGGGIVAFADRGQVKEVPEKSTSSIGDFLNSIGVNDAVNSLRESYYKTKEGVQRMERAEDVLPGPFESMTPSERAKRKAAGTEMFKGPKDVAKMTPAEIEAANAAIVGSTKPKAAPAGGLTPAEIEARNAEIMAGSNVDKAGNVTAPKPSAPQVTAKKPEGGLSGPKPSKAEVKSAVAKFAEQNDLGSGEKEGLMTTALKIREEFGKQNQPILDKLNAAIEGQKPNEQALKDRGIAQALAQFGFGMAERASKPGARFLESAAGASPILAAVADKTNSLIDTQKQNYTNLKLDQAKYEVALAKGDMQTAATLAGQIRQQQQQDKTLQFQIAKAQDDLQIEKAKLAQTGAYYSAAASRMPETVTGLAKQLMQDPTFKGTQNDAIAQAANMLKGGIPAGIRSETALAEARAKAIEKVDASLIGKLFALTRESDPKYAERKKKYDQQVLQQMQQLMPPGAMPSGVGAPTAGVPKLPSGVTVTEIGR